MSFGTFTKNGQTRVAGDASEAVRLKFTGWKPADTKAEQAAASTLPTPPPKNGAGSGTQAWADYAELLGVDVPDDASRDEIQAAVEAAGHRTE